MIQFKTIDGLLLRDMVMAGTALLEKNREAVDALNVFPGIFVYPSDANFVYIRLRGYDAVRIREEAAKRGYLIRVFDGNEEKHLRITIGTEDLMLELTAVLAELIPAAKINT